MKTILITTSSFGKHDPSLLRILSEEGLIYKVNPYGRKLTETEVSELILKFQPVGMIAGIEPLTRKVMEKAKSLKVISRVGIGMDSVDLQASKDFGIVVSNTPDGPTMPVAELTLGLILCLLRGIHSSDRNIRKENWVRPMGMLLYGKTVGVIGCGRIGSYLSKLLCSFGCNTLGYDLFPRENDLYKFAELNDLITNADVVTLHLPYSKETHHFMNYERIWNMKEGAFLINAARGGLVDEKALYDALKQGHLGGVAIDCFETEPYKGPLKELNNVVLTAHIGSYAKEGRIMMERQAVENLLRGLKKAGGIE